MPPIEVGPARALSAINARLARKAGGEALPHTNSTVVTARQGAASSVEKSEALDPGSPPVDVERVAQIRKAVENGTYPLVPAKIADAMIAAGVILRSGK